MAVKLQLRRGTSAEWSSANPVLAEGEIGIDTDELKGKIGDGATAWNSLAFGFEGSAGPQGLQGDTGPAGADGADGVGVPVGGTTGQVLRKASATDYDFEWATPAGSGDMLAATYDPTSVAGDAFDMDNMVEGTDTKILTAAERTKIAATRAPMSANLSLYVNGSTGSDSNDGLSSGAAFATLQKAVNTVAALDIATYNVTINVADATYTTGISVTAPWIGSGTVSVVGNTTTPANCTISTTSANCIALSNGARLTVSGFKLQATTGGQCLQATNNAALTVNGAIEIGAAPVYQVYAADGGTININTNYTLSGGSIYHWVALSGGRINWVNYTMTISGTPAFSGAFAYASRLGAISCHLGTFSGSATGTRYTVDSNSVIFTNGAGATYLPGNASGSASTGGQYI